MKVKELLDSGKFQVIHAGEDPDREITTPFCCDLLSVAMGKAPAGCVWVTVMGNMNTLAVATLADAACIILAEGAALDETARKKAEQKQTAPASGGFQIVSESGETDAQVEALLQARYDAKKAKDFTEADRIRDDLKAMGVEITDIPGGVRWKR